MGKDFVDGCNKARDKYHPIEMDPTISPEDKEKSMIDWWKNTQNLLLATKITKNLLRVFNSLNKQQAVACSNIYLRNGVCELLHLLRSAGMHLHIVSGGIKGVVTESFYILQLQRAIDPDLLIYCMTPETYDLSLNNTLVAFGEPMIMTTNKHIYMTHEMHPEIEVGGNAIVMGDILEDYNIVKSLKMSNVIGIGFLNLPGESSGKLLQEYMDTYDIVLANDGNLVHVLELIKNIIGMPMDPKYQVCSSAAASFAKLLY